MSFSVHLSPHPDASSSNAMELHAEGHWEDALLTLTYRLKGPLETLRFPTPETPAPPDRLWTRTCFEAFCSNPETPNAYCEYNFSPSGQWAAYVFSSYRALAETPPTADLRAPPIWRRTPDALSCSVRFSLPRTAWIRLGLAAVLEQKDGRLACFALRHPPGAPDFHHPVNFALELSRP
jgi:hypothetical protein